MRTLDRSMFAGSRPRFRLLGFSVTLALCAGSTGASAHLNLTFPPSRYGGDTLKSGPCGDPANPQQPVLITFEPGATVTVRWDEYVDHPGYYRISFSPNSDQDFADPTDYNDAFVNEFVLMDEIPDMPGGPSYEMDVTLPDVECTNCVLQVIQVMTDKPPWGDAGGNDIYYQCADIALQRGVGGSGGGGDTTTTTSTSTTGGNTDAGGATDSGGADSGGDSAGENDDGGGCRVTTTPTGTVPLLAVLFTLGFARRRRV